MKPCISEIMNKNPLSIGPNITLNKACWLMLKKQIRHLPVVDENNSPVGIISDREIRLAIDSPFLALECTYNIENLKKHTVSEIMKTSLYKVENNTSIKDAANLMEISKVGSLIVVDKDNKLAGIVSTSDLINYLIEILEIRRKNNV